MAFISLLFMILGTTAVSLGHRSSWISALGVVAASAGALIYGIDINSVVGQDNAQYYDWYQRSKGGGKFYEDVVFNSFLFILPNFLSEQIFSGILNLITLLLLSYTLLTLSRQFSVSFSSLGIVFLIILVDRIWLDLMYNTLRSTWAVLLFISAVSVKSSIIRFSLFVLAAGIHFYASMALLVFYLIAHMLMLTPRFLLNGSIVCVIIFLYKTNGGYFTSLIQLSEYLPLFESERFVRGTDIAVREYSWSQKTQIFVGVMVPIILAIWQIRPQIRNASLKLTDRKVLALGVVVTFFVVTLYPELWSVWRFSVVPMAIFLLLIDSRLLILLVWVKLIIIVGAFA